MKAFEHETGSSIRKEAPPPSRNQDRTFAFPCASPFVPVAFEGAVSSTNQKKNIRRAPVAIVGRRTARRLRATGGSGLLDSEPAFEPVPGSMLVLLSRLHRAERQIKPEDDPPKG
ncbi:hypothetical protein [Methylobacterium sp. E-045]|uniref:hypothetical protein n=1 Tax=Methylobacterium sp. E-045 TaxID=2836575 RepID=UPI001FBA359C|nr:hypothetical protein [Methylobacterium sp. E-045]